MTSVAARVQDKTLRFVRAVFSRYYRSEPPPPIEVREPQQREFAYWEFGKQVMVRHLSFQSVGELLRRLAEVVPLHAYRSSAYFRYPAAPMEEKGWEGADLVFDIDADHLDLPCADEHSYRVCPVHGLRNSDDGKCDECGSGLSEVEWVCDRCIEGARAELIKLLNVLTDDFGVSESEIEVGFSGNRGFHVVVYTERLRKLDQMARREIVTYLTCEGIDPSLLGLPWKGRRVRSLRRPSLDEPGWRGRIVRSVASQLERSGEVQSWLEDPDWGALRPSRWRELISRAISEERVNVDPVVTQDVHRLVRLPWSLNGKTGLAAARIPLDRVEDFDPFEEAAVLKGPPVRVRVLFAPRFRIGGEEFGPFEEPAEVKLPVHAAVYLILKGLAALASQ
ncbi:MAG: DNA primase small subunit domain-containing protein [Nitrososphaerota archaeon]